MRRLQTMTQQASPDVASHFRESQDLGMFAVRPIPNANTNALSKPGTKPRVIHLSKHCNHANGSVHVAVDLACVQAAAGYDVVFVSGGGTFVKMLEDHGVRHVTLPQDQKRPFRMLLSAFSLWRLCRQFKPAVIHAHMMGGAAIGYLVSLLTRIPLVTTVHNSFDPHSVIMRLGHKVVAVSKAERESLIKRGFKAQNVTSVLNAPNNSPREAFFPVDPAIKLSNPCIVVICALHKRKGVFDIIEAFRQVADQFPQWRLYIAGEGPDREALEAQSVALGLAKQVIFLGYVGNPRPLFRQSDIYVLASYADPGALSVGEARGAGCAIIATSVGGTTEMLEHGAAGRLVAPGAPDQIARELTDLMKNPEARAALKQAALAGAEIFNVERLVADYEAVYQAAQPS
jgi:glycosyltransferase involved in cell wall biosynthesis